MSSNCLVITYKTEVQWSSNSGRLKVVEGDIQKELA